MTIRAEDILPGPLPIWDQGTMVRGLTVKETRALIHAFRQIRDDYGRILVAYQKRNQEHAEHLVAVRDSNKIVVVALRQLVRARTKQAKAGARRFAKDVLARHDDDEGED